MKIKLRWINDELVKLRNQREEVLERANRVHHQLNSQILKLETQKKALKEKTE